MDLQRDLLEVIHILHVAERPSVKEVIQADIDVILAKIESLQDLLRNIMDKSGSVTAQ
jgi:hypothetical protein